MEPRGRASLEQFSTLVEYMESHGDLSKPQAAAQGRQRSEQLWQNLARTLNSVGGGVDRSAVKWKKVWCDWKSKTKKKALAIRRHARQTGGGPRTNVVLTRLEERVLNVIGPIAVEGQPLIDELGISRPSQSSQPLPTSVIVGHNSSPALNRAGDELCLYPGPQENSPVYDLPFGSHLLTNSPIPATTTQSTVLSTVIDLPVSPHPSTSSQIPATTTQSRVQRDRPFSPQPSTSRNQNAGSTTTQRPLFTTTPPPSNAQRPAGTPESVTATPRRVRSRIRRGRAVTPFERAASEFAAVELRRLDLEEARSRQQHEREIRAMAIEEQRVRELHEREKRATEVEHERNQFLRSLVDCAHAWLNYLQSRENTEPLRNSD